ncbi:ABC transporter [Streptomyces sp. C]|nr:ABC transporter [Streptomyces sp. C]
MIRFDQVSVTYDGAARPSLRDADFTLPEGELTLLVGPSGVGKSTLLGAVSGLVPHFTGGTLRGRVTVAGRDTRTHMPRELADVVGTVGQDPVAHFVTDVVEDELAYGMESLGLPPAVMRRRVEETLDLLGLNELRDRPIATLSGGQQQRVAIGSVLTTHPKVLVLDLLKLRAGPGGGGGGAGGASASGARPGHDGADGGAPPGAGGPVRRPRPAPPVPGRGPAAGHPGRDHGRLPGPPPGGLPGPPRGLDPAPPVDPRRPPAVGPPEIPPAFPPPAGSVGRAGRRRCAGRAGRCAPGALKRRAGWIRAANSSPAGV